MLFRRQRDIFLLKLLSFQFMHLSFTVGRRGKLRDYLYRHVRLLSLSLWLGLHVNSVFLFQLWYCLCRSGVAIMVHVPRIFLFVGKMYVFRSAFLSAAVESCDYNAVSSNFPFLPSKRKVDEATGCPLCPLEWEMYTGLFRLLVCLPYHGSCSLFAQFRSDVWALVSHLSSLFLGFGNKCVRVIAGQDFLASETSWFLHAVLRTFILSLNCIYPALCVRWMLIHVNS